ATLRLLSLANVRYLLSVQDLTKSGLDLQRVYRGEVQIYENPGVLPRAFIVHHIEAVADGQSALEKVIDTKVDLRAVGIMESEEQLPSQLQALMDRNENPPQEPCADRVEITRYEPQHVHVQVDLCKAGVIVLTDTYYAGWKVYVDGVEQRIYRTNYLFRGVYSERGRHEVRFVYDPLSYKAGLALSAASALICLLLFARRPRT
ncbi:MAG: YfhO family protein, partial [Candidatus Binatia bacterium]